MQRARGVLMDRAGDATVPSPGETPKTTLDKGNVGFTVSRPAGVSAASLEAIVHDWYDGSSAVRVKPVYDVVQPAGVDCLLPGVLTAAT